jgi:hypothetical protein
MRRFMAQSTSSATNWAPNANAMQPHPARLSAVARLIAESGLIAASLI